MKKSVTITLFIFFVICTAIITAGLLSYSSIKNKTSNRLVAGDDGSPVDSFNPSAKMQTPSALTLTPAEIAKHDSDADCWMIINGRVYNVTKAISAHPGAAAPILKYCGKDGSVGFQTKDIGQPHSQTAEGSLANYFIGSLNQAISLKNNTQNSPASDQPAAPKPVTKSVPLTTPPPIISNIALTLIEVAKHNSAGDCWMIVYNKVYNLTAYIPSHPGGSAMVPYCGKDGTVGFETKDKNPGKNHSNNASSLLANYLLGNLNQAVSSQNLQETINQQSTNPAPSTREDEDEEEDD